eukprot:snap_masked-scaffold_13-processed-gene-6.27-mRNA-1 protein AED:1.00 eAED:1.00 QI:0/-1/0/0/-1/1/1/0/194
MKRVLNKDEINKRLQTCFVDFFPDEFDKLLSEGANVNAQFAEWGGRSLLSEACCRGEQRKVRFLLSRAADVNLTDQLGKTCAHYAYECGHVELGNWLIFNTEIDIHIEDTQGRSVLDQRSLALTEHETDIFGTEKTLKPNFGTIDVNGFYPLEEEEKQVSPEETFVLGGLGVSYAQGSGLSGTRWLLRSNTRRH